MNAAVFDTGLGRGYVFWDQKGIITRVILPGTEPAGESGAAARHCPGGHPVLVALEAYFQGRRVTFNFARRQEGTAFQQKVWEALTAISYGQTRTYKETAAAVGSAGAARAVGQACAVNRLPVLIPCHRVVACGGLGGYSGGAELKKYLLTLEGVKV